MPYGTLQHPNQTKVQVIRLQFMENNNKIAISFPSK